jgi:hypothetical protein
MVDDRPPTFPALPEGYWSGHADDPSVQAFLEHVLRWREQVVKWLAGGHADDRLSPGLHDFLLWVLGQRAGPAVDTAPYAVSAFPYQRAADARVSRLSGRTIADVDVLDVLIWRALVVDFLADIWDTIGPPQFDVDECGYATALFMPDGEDGRRCPYCLQEYSGAVDPANHTEGCPIQRNALITRWSEAE